MTNMFMINFNILLRNIVVLFLRIYYQWLMNLNQKYNNMIRKHLTAEEERRYLRKNITEILKNIKKLEIPKKLRRIIKLKERKENNK